jgi:hypothetical protein
MMNACCITSGKSEGRKSLDRPRHRWKDNIKIYLTIITCEVEGWTELATDLVQ